MYHTASFPKLHHAKKEKGKKENTRSACAHTTKERERETDRDTKKCSITYICVRKIESGT
jgi:hypothetical protein